MCLANIEAAIIARAGHIGLSRGGYGAAAGASRIEGAEGALEACELRRQRRVVVLRRKRIRPAREKIAEEVRALLGGDVLQRTPQAGLGGCDRAFAGARIHEADG